MAGTPASSSDEDEQRAKLVQQQAKNEQLFVIIRKKCPQQQIINEIKECLNSGAEINTVNTRGKTILDIAHQKKYTNLLSFLLVQGAQATFDLDYTSNDTSLVQQHTKERSYDSHKMQHKIASISTIEVEKTELKAFLLADGKRHLTKDKLQKLNLHLKSNLDIQVIINELMKCGIDIHYKDPRTNAMAIDIAWENGHYESMLMLLQADSKFPRALAVDVIYDSSDIPEKLKAFVQQRQQLHYWIQNNKLEEIKNYISNHQLSKYYSIHNKTALEIAAEYADTETIACLSNLKFPLQQTIISNIQSDLLRQLNTESNTLLSIAAKSGKSDNVDFFIACGIDLNHRNRYNKRAIDLAWANKRYNVVLVLLKADSDFPNNFYLGQLNEDNDQKALKQFVERRNKLHKLIELNQLDDIKNITTFDKSKLYLNSYGQSALFTAIRRKRFEIYAFLKSIGLTFKNEDEEEYVNNLQLDEKDTLKTAMIREFPQVDKGHILYLISKSRSQKPVENFRECIDKLYRYLDGIPEISIILQVMQYTDYLDIVFDFDNDNIMDINPTASDTTRGTTDYKDGRIYIAAKTDEKQLSGTVAHELTHLAMYMIYQNDCNPFDKGENDQSQAFEIITTEIQRRLYDVIENMNGNEINPTVILATSFKYPRNEQQSELIARVPHIIAQYPRIGKHFLNTKFRSLYDYYNGMYDRCRDFIKNSFLIKPRNSMQFLNETLGEVNNITKYGIHFEEPIDLNSFLRSKKQVCLIETESTFLSILSIYESLITKNKDYSIQDSLFMEFNSYVEKEDEVVKLFYSPIGKILCLCYATDSRKEKLVNVLKTLKVLLSLKCDKKVLFVIQEKEKHIFHIITGTFKDNYKLVMDPKFTLNHFTKDCQQMLLERQILLLGENTRLNKFIDLSDINAKQVIDTTTLMKLIKDEKIEIGCKPQDKSYLEGAYSELFKKVNLETLTSELLSQDSKNAYVITGIIGPDKGTDLFNYLNNKLEDTGPRLMVNKLKSRIGFLNYSEDLNMFDQNILIADEFFNDKHFQKFCHVNAARKIYWLHQCHDGKELQFVLQKIYNPDFYITGKRFNQEVVIERNIVEELCSACLSDTFIIEVKHESELIRWFQFSSEQKVQFENNRKSNKIQFVTSIRSRKIHFQSHAAIPENQSIHLLDFKQDLLIWQTTYGSINILIKYRAKAHKNIQSLMDEKNVIKTIMSRKVTIFAGDPGTGKSTSLNQVCNEKCKSGELDSIVKSHWVIKINLKDYLQVRKKINFFTSDITDTLDLCEIIDFLVHVDTILYENSTKSFVKGLFGIILRNFHSEKPFFIVFDGFDEILDETNRNKIILLLKHLKENTNAKLCITTRFHCEKDLEASLSTFALRLEPMDNISVLNLVNQYYSNRFRLLLSPIKFSEIFDNDDDRMLKFANAFLIKMQEVFKGDVSKFIGTPLQLYLMLEVSIEYFLKKIQEKGCLESQSLVFSYLGHDIWEIYENFVNRKYEIMCFKTGLKEKIQQQEDKENFDNYHMDLAKFLLNIKSSVKESFKKFQDIVLLVGIVRSDGRNLDFIHSTFAEYFAAKALINWIIKWQKKNVSKRKNFQKQQYFCSKILSGANYRVIRSFLNVKFLKEKITNLQLREEYYNDKILFVSAMENHIGIAEFVVTNFSNVNINVRDHNDHTVLYVAATFVNTEMIQWLVEKGADINAKNENGRTALHVIVKYGSLEIIKWLIERGADANEKDKYGRSILHYAATSDRLEIVKWLVDNGADITSKEESSLNVLHEIIASGNNEMLKYLIDRGADVNAVNKDGWTFLHTASRDGRLETVKLLLDKGADINAEDNYGCKALHEAVRTGRLEIVQYLVNMYAQFKAKATKDGKILLQIAVIANYLDIIKYLVEHFLVDKDADFNYEDLHGRKILHQAAAFGSFDIINYLVDNGANINAEDKNGKRLLHDAAAFGCLEKVKWLVQKGADVNAEDKNGQTILHQAAASGHFDIIKYLIDCGAHINAEDKNGKRPLHEAVAFGCSEIVQWLVLKGADFND